MVKSLNYEDFVNNLDKLYTESHDKYTVYLTFKRRKNFIRQSMKRTLNIKEIKKIVN